MTTFQGVLSLLFLLLLEVGSGYVLASWLVKKPRDSAKRKRFWQAFIIWMVLSVVGDVITFITQ